MDLSKLTRSDASRKTARRVGRGRSSGAGKTCGRGGKGQTARTGGTVRAGFEGGQMPLIRRIPKLGFRSRQRTLGLNIYHVIDLSILERFDAGSRVDEAALEKIGFGVSASQRAGVKVLGTGTLSKKLTVVVNAISQSARAKIEAAGGSIELVTVARRSASREASTEKGASSSSKQAK